MASLDVALQGEGVLFRRLAVQAKSALNACGEFLVLTCRSFDPVVQTSVGQVGPDGRRRPDLSPEACVESVGAAAVDFCGGRSAQRVHRMLADDVDDAVDCVGPPQRCSGPADDLDALDVFQRKQLLIPEHAAEVGNIDRPAIHQHQQLVGRAAVEAARRDRRAGRGQLSDLHPRNHPQDVRDVRCSRATDVFLRHHEDRRGDFVHALRLLGHRRNFR